MVPFFVGAGAVVPVRLVALVPGVPLSVAGIPPMYKPKVPVGALALPDAPDETALILALLDWLIVHVAVSVMPALPLVIAVDNAVTATLAPAA